MTNGYSLSNPKIFQYIFYKENTLSIIMRLSEMKGNQPAIAIDTKKEYHEINLGNLTTGITIWQAPYRSDWAIAIGKF